MGVVGPRRSRGCIFSHEGLQWATMGTSRRTYGSTSRRANGPTHHAVEILVVTKKSGGTPMKSGVIRYKEIHQMKEKDSDEIYMYGRAFQ